MNTGFFYLTVHGSNESLEVLKGDIEAHVIPEAAEDNAPVRYFQVNWDAWNERLRDKHFDCFKANGNTPLVNLHNNQLTISGHSFSVPPVAFMRQLGQLYPELTISMDYADLDEGMSLALDNGEVWVVEETASPFIEDGHVVAKELPQYASGTFVLGDDSVPVPNDKEAPVV